MGFDYALESVNVLCITRVSRTKGRIDPDSAVGVVERLSEGHELHVCCSTVVVASSVGGVALDALRVQLDSPCKVAPLECCIALFTRSSRLGRVDVSLAFCLCDRLFSRLEFGEDDSITVLGKGLLEVLFGRGKLALL